MQVGYIVLIVVGVILLGYIVGVYNGLIKQRVRCEEGWSDIDVQLKRRYNLIPNLIETVKGYATHEKEVFTEVTKARTAAMDNNGTPGEQAKTENMLQGALKSLFAVAENYPKLQANQNFLDLQQQLADTEDKIQASRRFYNGTVRDFNTSLQVFPKNIVAGIFSFVKREFFEIENKEERKNIKVDFSKKEENKKK